MGSDEKLKTSVSIAPADVESQKNEITTIVSPHTGKPIHLTATGDDAMDYVMSHDGDKVELDPETDRKLVRKIDLYLLPLICLLYSVQFMDKMSNSYAAVMGLREDLDMHGDMYAWTGSAFYLGYLALEFPCAYTLQRFPVITTVSVYIIIWGIILMLHAVPNYAGFVALRTLLGAFESSVTPAFVIVTSQWYRKDEVFLRTALWFSFNGLGLIIGSGAIAYNLHANMDSYSIDAWKLIFIITGAITIALGVVIFFHIPNKPTEAWFLNDKEKSQVVERIRVNQQGFGNKHFKKYQLIEAFTDVKTWLYFFLAVANNIPNGGLTNFGSILLNEDFGYGVGKTLQMQMIPGAVEVVGCIGFAYLYKYYPNRLFWATSVSVIVIMALCLVAFVENRQAQLAGYCLFYLCPLVMICGLSSCASNVAGHTKKVTVNAIFLIGYCVGNLIGPQTFIDAQAPGYSGAKIAMVVSSACATLIMIAIWIIMARENKRRDERATDYLEFQQIENHEFADLTDMENPMFRYTI
ncbi:hypothetical protein C7M61_001751 [Candidozyma pseudohaemuli]|uniref:Major facilitator superfamily (MFS) profile domain-containing protein n=1 Tax=Candidozyma pseudohaemuli TaxID=418784 RepID=A0A2P7YVE9_9ASCO|nr:hypothetical protein C7M61_001751 [[Candida] pseudohaemulonii]PSK39940.1 hypothetical protein C7M61_001751 [[Candida] pseudohaemulonii]